MSYIDKSLGDGETVIARAHFHWLYVSFAWLCLLIPAALLLAALGKSHADGFSLSDPTTAGAGVAAILLILGLLVFLKMMFRKWSTEIGVTSHRFVEKYGLLSMRTNEIALPNIEGVRVTQNFWGQLLGYGSLRIEGTGVDHIDLPNIADPLAFRAAIETAKSGGG